MAVAAFKFVISGKTTSLNFSKIWARVHHEPTASTASITMDGNYSPDNCHWATPEEQNRNQARNHWLTFNGETEVLEDWARSLGIASTTLINRLNKGWPLQKTLTTPNTAKKRAVP